MSYNNNHFKYNTSVAATKSKLLLTNDFIGMVQKADFYDNAKLNRPSIQSLRL